MFQMILSIIFLLAALALLGVGIGAKENGTPAASRKSLAGALVCAVLFVAVCTFSVVPAGSTGVLVTLGSPGNQGMQSGPHFKIPFAQKIVMIDNRVQRTDVDGSGASRDLQAISTSVSVNYRVQPAQSAAIYREVGTGWENVIVRPAVQECMKAVQSQYTAEELITKRSEVGQAMQESIAEKVGRYGLIVDNINILNMDFSDEFNAAIEAKQTAQQNALKAEQDLARIEVEAKQKIVTAQAEADANRIRSESITNEILTSNAIAKWDGKLPAVMSDTNSILDVAPMIGQ